MGYDIGCQSVFTDEDEQMLEEAKHRVGEIDPEVLKRYWESGAYARAQAGTVEAVLRHAEFELGISEAKRFVLEGAIPKEEIEQKHQELAARERMTFRTTGGEFEILYSKSHLSAEELKHLYRVETPDCVTRGLRGVADVDKARYDERGHRVLGQYIPDPITDKPHMVIYRQALHTDVKRELKRLNPQERTTKEKELLREREYRTRRHEVGHEIWEKHLPKEALEQSEQFYERAVREGWIRKVCDHGTPTPKEFFCDAYAHFQNDPAWLRHLDAETFRFAQDMFLALEHRDQEAHFEL